MSQSKLFKTGDMHAYLETVGGADLSVSRVSLLDLSHVFVHGSSFTSRSLSGSVRRFLRQFYGLQCKRIHVGKLSSNYLYTM